MRGPSMERQISVYDSKTRSQRFVTIGERSPRLQNIRMKREDFHDEEHYYPMIVGKGGEVTILDTGFRKEERRPLRTTPGSYYTNAVTAKYDMSKTDRKRSDSDQRYVVQPGTSVTRDYCRLAQKDLKSSLYSSSTSSCKERDRVQELNYANRIARARENIAQVPRSQSDAHLYVNPYDRDDYCRIAGAGKKTRELRQNSLPTTRILGLQELHKISSQTVDKTSSRVLESQCGRLSRQSSAGRLTRENSVDTATTHKTFKQTEYKPRERILYSTSESDDSDIECCGHDSDEFIDYCSCMCCVKGILYHYSKDTDNEGRLADDPCSCTGAGCLLRWGCLGVMSIFLPCLLCYLPAKGCAKLASKCNRRKKNSKSKKVSYHPTKD